MNHLARLLFLILEIVIFSLAGLNAANTRSTKDTTSGKIETFTFSSNGKSYKGKIYIPLSYETNKSLPAIFLIDFTEQHFKLAHDEFEKVIEGVQQLQDTDALVVSLEGIPDIDAEPANFQEHYAIFKSIVLYVDEKYTKNTSRTLIGRGSESGVVLCALFAKNTESLVFDNFIATDPSGLYGTYVLKLIENGDFPTNKNNLKLHFSFSTSNDRTKCMKLISLIEKANFPWLQFESIEYTDSDYENTYPISYAAGIKYIFSSKPTR